jgi:peptidoglycan hydrolase CwlO-like protein
MLVIEKENFLKLEEFSKIEIEDLEKKLKETKEIFQENLDINYKKWNNLEMIDKKKNDIIISLELDLKNVKNEFSEFQKENDLKNVEKIEILNLKHEGIIEEREKTFKLKEMRLGDYMQ